MTWGKGAVQNSENLLDVLNVWPYTKILGRSFRQKEYPSGVTVLVGLKLFLLSIDTVQTVGWSDG